MTVPPAAATRDSARSHRQFPTNFYRFRQIGTTAARVACSVVCVLVLLSDASADSADGHGRMSSAIAQGAPSTLIGPGRVSGQIQRKRRDLDLRLGAPVLVEPRQPGNEGSEVSSSLRLFVPVRRAAGVSTEGGDRRGVSSLRIRENSFPSRKIALQGAVREGFFLKLSVGVDHELERGGIGRARPSVGLLFEKTFR